MLLTVVLLMLCGFGGMFAACWRHPKGDLSPLFETSLLVAVVGLALTIIVAIGTVMGGAMRFAISVFGLLP